MPRTRTFAGPLAALLFATACGKDAIVAPAAAETPSPAAAVAAQRAPAGPIDRILARASELGLSRDQVARLSAIDARLTERTAPLRARLREVLGERPRRGRMSDAEREAWRARREKARPIVRELRESSREAMAEVREVLTDAQESAIRERLRRPGRRGRLHGRGG